MTEKRTNEQITSDTISSIFRWFKGMAAAFMLSIVALVIVGLVTVHGFDQQRARDRELDAQSKAQDATQLQARIIEGCLNFNRSQTQSRRAAHQTVFALAELSGRGVIDETTLDPDQKARLATFDLEQASLFAYRHCDPTCAVTYTSKDLPDCPPSDNEEGT